MFNGFVKTFDEQDKEFPVKNFPKKEYLKTVADILEQQQLVLLFKSRQLMVSWLVATKILHECLTPAQRWAVICKKFGAADALLSRIEFITRHLPEGFAPKVHRKEGLITIYNDHAESYIHAFSQAAEEPRQNAYSGIWVDEAEFTDNIDEIHTAALPGIQKGGKFWATTTPNGRKYFWLLASEGGQETLQWP